MHIEFLKGDDAVARPVDLRHTVDGDSRPAAQDANVLGVRLMPMEAWPPIAVLGDGDDGPVFRFWRWKHEADSTGW